MDGISGLARPCLGREFRGLSLAPEILEGHETKEHLWNIENLTISTLVSTIRPRFSKQGPDR